LTFAALNTPSKVTAGSLYEAVAQALRIFRENEWIEGIGRGQTPISVKVKHPETEHTVRVQDFERWLEASPRSRAELARRKDVVTEIVAVAHCGPYPGEDERLSRAV
jgi:hypothetical protein